jgi:hypothetical protein
MVVADGEVMHAIRTENIESKIDVIMQALSGIDNKLYALIETNPEAKKKYEELEETLRTMKKT